MDEMNQQRNNRKKLLLTLIPVLVLVVAVVGVTYAFFNYTRAGANNSIGTGRINFVSTQSGTTSISNYFPQIPGGAQASQSSTATITVTGGTTFSGGITYYVKLIDVKVGNDAYNPETDVPVNIDVAEVSGLTVANRGTFTPEGTNHSGVGIALSEGVVIANGTIGVADTAANSDNWINGTFTVQAYIPSNVAISDTTGEYETTEYVNGTTTEWVAERRVLTTAQWNALSANPVTFKIQVVANEGLPPVTINYNANGGTIATASKTIAPDATVYGTLAEPTPANDNYYFGGWYTAAEGGTKVTSDTTFTNGTSATTLYAHWIGVQGAAKTIINNVTTLETTDYGKIYTGSNPDNYVLFNCQDDNDTSTCEQWRIIGVYGDKLKIVRATPLTTSQKYNADSSKGNAWSGSDLETFLNGDYYSGVADQGLTATARGMIAEGTWNAGATTNTATANTAYQAATETQVSKNVGLIATYEYLYAAGSSCRTVAGSTYDSGSPSCASGDWLKPSSGVWTLSPNHDNSSIALRVYSYGYVFNRNVNITDGVLPAVYLDSSITITGGNGGIGETNSYKLG